MIPIDNSIAGRVADIHHLLPTSGPAHRRRALPADPFPADGVPRTPTSTRSRPCTATSTRSASAARSSASSGCKPVIAGDTAGAAREVAEAERPDPGRARAAAWPPRSTASRSSPRTSRTRTTTPPASSCCRATPDWAPPRQRPDGDQLRLPRPQPAGRALQGARRLRHQRRQHDQARELHGRRRVLRDPVLRRGRRPPRGHARSSVPSRSSRSSRSEVQILGVYPAHPFREKIKEPG